jgi:protocatechuate 3,4-dioxygenase beta subunit
MDDHANIEPTERRLTRRGTLLKAGGLLGAVVGASAWRALDDEDASASGLAAVESGAVSCVLAPELTEGPYYVPDERMRRDITEGKAGMPLTLRLRVLDVSTCKPIKGAAVDIWHCDALGVYSGFGSGSGNRTFMRGVQRTDRNGLARFRSVYPGWYRGRTVHIHVKVHVAGDVVHTGQLYFPDAVTDKVFRRKPYSRRGRRSTRNANDFVFAQGGRRSMLRLRKAGTAYVGSITMGVSR